VIRRPRASRVLPWLIPWSALVVGLAWLRLSPDPTGVLVSRLALLAIQVVSGSLLVGHLAAHRLDPRTIIVAASLVAAGAMTHTGALYIPLFTRPDHAPLQDIGRAACAGATVLGGVTLYRWRGGATWLLVGLTALACIAGTATLSRQGIWSFLLAMCAVLPLVLLHRPVRRAKLLWLALGPLIVLIMAVVVAMLDPEQAQQLARLRFTQNPLAAFDTRRDVYLTAWRMFTERPLLGWGFGGFGPRVGAPALYPHNVVLEILAEFGLLGLVLWLAPLGLGFAARDHAAHTTDSYDDALHRTTLLALVVYWFGISSSSYSLPHGSFLFPALCWLPPALVRRDRLRAVGEETAGGADDA
jgi:O-antigen ligase